MTPACAREMQAPAVAVGRAQSESDRVAEAEAEAQGLSRRTLAGLRRMTVIHRSLVKWLGKWRDGKISAKWTC